MEIEPNCFFVNLASRRISLNLLKKKIPFDIVLSLVRQQLTCVCTCIYAFMTSNTFVFFSLCSQRNQFLFYIIFTEIYVFLHSPAFLTLPLSY